MAGPASAVVSRCGIFCGLNYETSTSFLAEFFRLDDFMLISSLESMLMFLRLETAENGSSEIYSILEPIGIKCKFLGYK
jgi:hypothetical protein